VWLLRVSRRFSRLFCGDSNFVFVKFPTLPSLTGGRVGQPHPMPRRQGIKSCPRLPDTPQLLPVLRLNRAVGASWGAVNKANWQHALHSQWLEDINQEQAEAWWWGVQAE